ncbi:hypothetical protein CCYA_CCYA15G3985 [Cyanidiococcus yangmingshanensis]|nr:hypothetical protein CCYA_CCYA15G3985 [Cyanidiococcus yangmingshanensis]
MFRCVRWRSAGPETVQGTSETDHLDRGTASRPRRVASARFPPGDETGRRLLRWWRLRGPRFSGAGQSTAPASGVRAPSPAESRCRSSAVIALEAGTGGAPATQAASSVSLVSEEAHRIWVALLRREKTPADRAELRCWIRDNLDTLSREWQCCEATSSEHGSGWTALKQAAYFGHTLAVQLLLEYGAWREMLPVSAFLSNNRPGNSAGIRGRVCEGPPLLVSETDRIVPAALYLAAQNGHLDALREMLRYRSPEQRNQRLPPPDVNCRTAIGWTPLFIAAWNGHEEVCQLLLAAGADPRARDNNEWTPIMAAVTRNHIAVVRLLIEVAHVHPQHVRARRGWTPIHAAAERGSVEMVQLLLQHGAEPSVANGEGWTPLHAAAKNGHLAVLRVLVERGGANPNLTRHDGFSVLHTAARYGHTDIVCWLLTEADASPLQRDRAGRTALHTAAACGHAEICNLLVCLSPAPLIDISNQAGESALSVAFTARRYDLCLWLLQLGAHLPGDKRRSVIGRKLMHYLSTRWWQQTSLVRPSGAALVEARVGALSTAVGVSDESADRHFFATVVCIRRLVSLGVDVNIKRKLDGGTPLHTAAALANAQGIEAFVQAVGGGQHGALALEAATIGPGTRGETPLHYACAQAHLVAGAETVLALLRAGSNPWARDRHRRTPLHVAAAVGARDDILRTLVERGASRGDLVYARDNRGATPLDIAREAGKTKAHLVLTSLLGMRQTWNSSVDDGARSAPSERSSWPSAPNASRSASRDLQRRPEEATATCSETLASDPNDAAAFIAKLQTNGIDDSLHMAGRGRDSFLYGTNNNMPSHRLPSQRPHASSTVYTPSSRASSVTSNSTLPLYRDSMVEYRWTDRAVPSASQMGTADDAAPASSGSALFSQITNASTSQSSGEQPLGSEALAGTMDPVETSIGSDSFAHTSTMAGDVVPPALSNCARHQHLSLPVQPSGMVAAPPNSWRTTLLSRVMTRDWWPTRPQASAPPIINATTEPPDLDIGRQVNGLGGDGSSDTYSEISAAPSALFDSSLSIADSILAPLEHGSDAIYRLSVSEPPRALIEPECAVCAESGPCVQWTAYNCGHCTCQKCAERLFECPMCRVTITSRIRLYL